PRNLPPPCNRLCRISSMLERVPIPLRCARRHSPVHPASTVLHRRRLTQASASCPRSASLCLVHIQVHGVVPLISVQTLPPGSRRYRQWPVRLRRRGHARPSSSAGPCLGG